MDLNLRDKIVIVTGGAAGIGRATVARFENEGATVLAWDVTTEPKIDVTNREEVEAAVNDVVAKYGRIDVLVNNAAVFSVVPMNRGRIESIDPEEWDRLMAVNLRGLFFCCRAVLPAMRRQKSGKIVNIASGTVLAGAPGRIHYVTSKAATIGFTRTLAREVGGDNINVNCLAPGNTLSEENPTAQMIKFRESSVGLRALKRIQVPQDVVGAMLFLASPLSDFMTGQTVNVDGGISFL